MAFRNKSACTCYEFPTPSDEEVQELVQYFKEKKRMEKEVVYESIDDVQVGDRVRFWHMGHKLFREGFVRKVWDGGQTGIITIAKDITFHGGIEKHFSEVRKLVRPEPKVFEGETIYVSDKLVVILPENDWKPGTKVRVTEVLEDA